MLRTSFGRGAATACAMGLVALAAPALRAQARASTTAKAPPVAVADVSAIGAFKASFTGELYSPQPASVFISSTQGQSRALTAQLAPPQQCDPHQTSCRPYPQGAKLQLRLQFGDLKGAVDATVLAAALGKTGSIKRGGDHFLLVPVATNPPVYPANVSSTNAPGPVAMLLSFAGPMTCSWTVVAGLPKAAGAGVNAIWTDTVTLVVRNQ